MFFIYYDFLSYQKFMERLRWLSNKILTISLLTLIVVSCKNNSKDALLEGWEKELIDSIPGTVPTYHLKIVHRNLEQEEIANDSKISFAIYWSELPIKTQQKYNDYFDAIEKQSDLICQYQYCVYMFLKNSPEKFTGFSETIQFDWRIVKEEISHKGKLVILDSIKELNKSKKYEDLSEITKDILYAYNWDFLYMIAQEENTNGQSNIYWHHHNINIWFEESFIINNLKDINKAIDANDLKKADFLIQEFRDRVITTKNKKANWNLIILWWDHDLSDNIEWTLIEITNKDIMNQARKVSDVINVLWQEIYLDHLELDNK